MEGMREYPDNYFDLAVVDPPYFSGPEKRAFYGKRISTIGVKRIYKTSHNWDLPTKEYFQELYRVSKNQIIFGVNYFTEYMNFGSGRIIWDKCNGNSSFSDCEIAYCSMHDSVRLFPFMWNGMMQGKSIADGRTQQGDKRKNEVRIHQTQKPVKLYEWIYTKYANAGMKILDTHLGSGSSRIAAYNMDLNFVGFEIDEVYFYDQEKRWEEATQQIRIVL